MSFFSREKLPLGIVGIVAVVILILVLVFSCPGKKAKLDQLISDLNNNKDLYLVCPEIPELSSAAIEINKGGHWSLSIRADGSSLYYENLTSETDVAKALKDALIALRKKYEQ